MREARRMVPVALLFLAAAWGQESARLNNAGSKALAAGEVKAALAQFEDAAKLDPENLEIRFNIGLALERLGRPAEAVIALERAAADPKVAVEARYLMGSCFFQLAEYAKAIEALKDLDQGPRAEHVLYMLEESNRLLGRSAEAREAFRRLNRGYPDSAWVHYLLGVAHENRAELDQAIEEYKLALAREAKLPNAAFAIGYLYWRQHDYGTAKQWLEKQLALQPCHALAGFYLGQIASAGQDRAAAARYYSGSLACDADSAEAHLRLGVTLAEMNQNDDALGELNRAIELAPGNPSAHYRRAVLYRKLGRTEESKAEYETVRRLQAKKDGEPSPKP